MREAEGVRGVAMVGLVFVPNSLPHTSPRLSSSAVVLPLALLFFGGDISLGKDGDQDTVIVDDFIVFHSPVRRREAKRRERAVAHFPMLIEVICRPRQARPTLLSACGRSWTTCWSGKLRRLPWT